MSPGSTTSPPRGFTPEELSLLPREQRRQLCYGLIVELGLQVREVDRRAEYDDLIVDSTPLLAPRSARIRILYRPSLQDDILDLADLAQVDNLSDFLLISTYAERQKPVVADSHYVSAVNLIELLEASALVQWSGRIPQVAHSEFNRLRAYQEAMPVADTVGLRWLTSLALNKLPRGLHHLGGSSEEWFERYFFRVATQCLRLRGRRLGTTGRGQRLPDGLLAPIKTHAGFLYDCKAARDGYVMTADHERRFIEYGRRNYDLDGSAIGIGSIVIVSSHFPGERGPQHPFHARQRSIKEGCGQDLAYVRAADLTGLVMELGEQNSTSSVEAIDWTSALIGLVDLDSLRRATGVM
jgi:hypothetical protein